MTSAQPGILIAPQPTPEIAHYACSRVVCPFPDRPHPFRHNTPALVAQIQTFQQRCHDLAITDLAHDLPAAWSAQRRAIAIAHYGYFLGLIDLYPHHALVPTPTIDRVWHLHILDTRRYRHDCLALFGQFIDHQPFRAQRSQQASHHGSLEETVQLLQHHFGLDRSSFKGDRAASCGACGRVIQGNG